MSEAKRKNYRLTEECLQILKDTQESQHFMTETDALHHIILEYARQKKDVAAKEERKEEMAGLAELIAEKLIPQIRRIYAATAATERQSYLILDAINTMLYDSSATFLMEAKGQLRHEVIRQSEENYIKMLEHRKQIRDNRLWKEGVMEYGRDPDSGTGG